jgi:hypothetical protein
MYIYLYIYVYMYIYLYIQESSKSLINLCIRWKAQKNYQKIQRIATSLPMFFALYVKNDRVCLYEYSIVCDHIYMNLDMNIYLSRLNIDYLYVYIRIHRYAYVTT